MTEVLSTELPSLDLPNIENVRAVRLFLMYTSQDHLLLDLSNVTTSLEWKCIAAFNNSRQSDSKRNGWHNYPRYLY